MQMLEKFRQTFEQVLGKCWQSNADRIYFGRNFHNELPGVSKEASAVTYSSLHNTESYSESLSASCYFDFCSSEPNSAPDMVRLHHRRTRVTETEQTIDQPN